MFGFSFASQFLQGSAERTWNCVSFIANTFWYKFNHLKLTAMPRSRRRHSRSRSRSRSHSHDKDREAKRRKIDTYFDSPVQKRSVSAEPAPEESKPVENPHNDQIEEPKTDQVIDLCDGEEEDNSMIIEAVVYKKSPQLPLTPKTEANTSVNMSSQESDNVTPKRVGGKKLQIKLDSEKKRLIKQQEKEEKEKQRQLQKEEKERQRLEKIKQKQKEIEDKQKEKDLKEEQRKKEKEEKEEQKKREKEEKEQKRKEKEEKEEQKRKEKEQERLKRQQEQDEKNKEKLKLMEKNKRTSAAFVSFFVPKKGGESTEEKKIETGTTSNFKAFQIKSDMKLPPKRRASLTENEKESLERDILAPTRGASYIKDLKNGKAVLKCGKTWPYEEVAEDCAVVDDDLGETICEEDKKVEKMRSKFILFADNKRPPYFGTYRKISKTITGRKPFAQDTKLFDYEVDSDDDWEEEEQGESLENGSEDDEKENEAENEDYEVDNEFFVPHGHLSDDEVDDEQDQKLSPESQKQKLKLLKDEFDQDMQSKTHKLKPRSIGCIWYNKDGSNVDEAINRFLQPLAMMTNGQIVIKKRTNTSLTIRKKALPLKELPADLVPVFIKFLHGNVNKKRSLVEEFTALAANNGFDSNKSNISKHITQMAQYLKCPEGFSAKNKFCWLVRNDILQKYELKSEDLLKNVKVD